MFLFPRFIFTLACSMRNNDLEQNDGLNESDISLILQQLREMPLDSPELVSTENILRQVRAKRLLD